MIYQVRNLSQVEGILKTMTALARSAASTCADTDAIQDAGELAYNLLENAISYIEDREALIKELRKGLAE